MLTFIGRHKIYKMSAFLLCEEVCYGQKKCAIAYVDGSYKQLVAKYGVDDGINDNCKE